MSLLPSSRLRAMLKGALVGLVLGALLRLLKLRQLRQKLSQWFAGPPESLLRGNRQLLEAYGGSPAFPTTKFLVEMHRQYGKVFRFWTSGVWSGLGALNLAFIEPADCKQILDLAPHRSLRATSPRLADYLGTDSLMFQRGPMVEELRLHYRSMVSTTEATRASHRITTDLISKHTVNWHRGPVDASGELHLILYDVLGQLFFKLPLASHPLGVKMRTLHKFCTKHSTRWAAFRFEPWWHPEFREYRKAAAELRGICGQLLEERRAAEASVLASDSSCLAMICKARDKNGAPFFSQHSGVSAMLDLMNGALDTTHATVCWLLYHLAKHPAKQQVLIQELDSRIGRRLTPSLEDLRELPYLHACIQESMRLRMTVPHVSRENRAKDLFIGQPYDDEDLGFFGEVFVPAGTPMHLSLSAAAKLARYFGPFPLEFRPERFLGDDPASTTARSSWMAFGGGAGMCAGMQVALAEIKAVVGVLLQRYSVSLQDPLLELEGVLAAGVLELERPLVLCFDARPEERTL